MKVSQEGKGTAVDSQIGKLSLHRRRLSRKAGSCLGAYDRKSQNEAIYPGNSLYETVERRLREERQSFLGGGGGGGGGGGRVERGGRVKCPAYVFRGGGGTEKTRTFFVNRGKSYWQGVGTWVEAVRPDAAVTGRKSRKGGGKLIRQGTTHAQRLPSKLVITTGNLGPGAAISGVEGVPTTSKGNGWRLKTGRESGTLRFGGHQRG